MELLKKYFPSFDDELISKFVNFKKEFISWNEKINCISRKDIENFEERHILHSLAISKVIQFESGAQVIDVGTGGGFPGLPLAIMFPEVEFHLIDSIGKKVKVVEGVKDALNLKNVRSSKTRSEDLHDKYDFIVARAVARASTFHHWVGHLKNNKSKLKNPGIYYLKGGDLKEEMLELKRPFKVWDLKEFYEEEFFDTKKVVYF